MNEVPVEPTDGVHLGELYLALVGEVSEAGFSGSHGVKPDPQAFAITNHVLVIAADVNVLRVSDPVAAIELGKEEDGLVVVHHAKRNL